MLKQIKNDIEKSQRILITSHFGPDPDAVAGALFTYGILKQNFPDKEIFVVNEDAAPDNLRILKYIDQIQQFPLIEALKKYKPDLLIGIDGGDISRFTRRTFNESVKFLDDHNVKLLIIDHHEPIDISVKKYKRVNNKRSSAAEETYRLFKEQLKFEMFEGYADILMLGILGDTGQFKFYNPNHRETFSLVSDLIDAGSSIEKLLDSMKVFQMESLPLIAELMNNVIIDGQYAYSYITDETSKKYEFNLKNAEIFSDAYHYVVDHIIRKVENIKWGFVVIRDLSRPGEMKYKGGFRVSGGVINTTVFAEKLGGGGHKSASGFNFVAKNVEDAIERLRKTIKENMETALATSEKD